jgi:hypothetical protein
MAPSDDERPTVNHPGSWVAFAVLFVLGVGGLFLGLTMQGQNNKTTGSRSYDLTPEQYEENTRWARERAAEQPAPSRQPPSNQKIDNCLKANKCAVQLRGEVTANPVMSFIVAEEIWAAFDEKDKSEVRTLLKHQIEQAKAQPGAYTDIPASAPFYRKALDNIRNTKSYSVILSRGQRSSGALSVDKEILVDF